jgi:hypothetical protein
MAGTNAQEAHHMTPTVWEHLLDAIVQCAKHHAPHGQLALAHYAWINDSYQGAMDELARIGAEAHESGVTASAVERAVLDRVGELRQFFSTLQGLEF